MITGELRSKIDTVWNAFWAGGIANPLEVIEQITYLLFMRGLDEGKTRAENKANRLGKPMGRRVFPEGKDGIGANWRRRVWGHALVAPEEPRPGHDVQNRFRASLSVPAVVVKTFAT